MLVMRMYRLGKDELACSDAKEEKHGAEKYVTHDLFNETAEGVFKSRDIAGRNAHNWAVLSDV